MKLRIGVLFLLSLGIFFQATSADPAFAEKKGSGSVVLNDLSNDIALEKIKIHRPNDKFWRFRRPVRCENGFSGTQDGNRLYLRLMGSGGSGHYKHHLSYFFSNDYDMEHREGGQKNKFLAKNGVIHVDLPRLKPDVPFMQQYVTLVTTDTVTGKQVTSAKAFLVSRSFILRESLEELSCKETYTPKLVSAEMGNQTTLPALVDIKKTEERIYGRSTNKQFGIYINPIVGFPPGMFLSLFAINYSLFQEVSKQSIEIYDVNQQFSLQPGDFLQIYRQDTRMVEAYDAAQVDVCGQVTDLPQAYMIQRWQHAYHAVVVDPFGVPKPLKAIGAEVKNTCPAAYNPNQETVLDKKGVTRARAAEMQEFEQLHPVEKGTAEKSDPESAKPGISLPGGKIIMPPNPPKSVSEGPTQPVTPTVPGPGPVNPAPPQAEPLPPVQVQDEKGK